MKNIRITICLVLLFMMSLLVSCGSATERTVLEMELDENYGSADPFVNEALFCVSDDIDTLELNISFQMEGESGILEIADNETEEVFWSGTWKEDTEPATFTVTLENATKEREYVIKFTGTKIKYAKIILSAESDLVQERDRPRKSNRS